MDHPGCIRYWCIMKRDRSNRASMDPGGTGAGLCIWPEEEWNQCLPPVWMQNVYPVRRVGPWLDRTMSVLSQIADHLDNFKPSHLYCECPQFFEGTRGMASAGSGDLVKLCLFTGGIIEVCRVRDTRLHLIDVNEWKGQLPKDVVERRIYKRLPQLEGVISAHVVDGVGIGLYAKGFFNETRSRRNI
jgi:hypothetical protein